MKTILRTLKTVSILELLWKLPFLLLTYYLIVQKAWVGEDAYIFFKYVDNFLNGYGLVFNIGERIEGFTSPLWVFLLSLVKYLFLVPLRPAAIILGFILTLLSVAILLFVDTRNKITFPLGVILLITNYAFRDFATSGFETSLMYFLLILFTVLFKKNYLHTKPVLLGIIISLLVLTRPESFLLFVYTTTLLIADTFRTTLSKTSHNGFSIVKDKQVFKAINIRKLVSYLSPFILIAGSYQIFRMGYYAAFMPNTYYAKKGGEVYISQGINYIKDFFSSYSISVLIIVIFFILVMANYMYKFTEDKYKKNRLHLLTMSLLLLGFVLRSGGDYMHGRSLLMWFIVIVVTLNDIPDILLAKASVVYKTKQDTLASLNLGIYIALLVSFLLLVNQVPTTKKLEKQINNIEYGKGPFGSDFKSLKLSEYINRDITWEYGWRDRGFYYRDVSNALKLPIRVNMPNIGLFGYAANLNVNVIGCDLIDPYLARKQITQRGKIGHEGTTDWPYILSRRPTFSYTPFTEWNSIAHFKYVGTPYSVVITDDSNGSFIPLLDLSNNTFIDAYSKLINKDIRTSIDTEVLKYLKSLDLNNIKDIEYTKEYLGFLNVYWYPYTNSTAQNEYNRIRGQIPGTELSSYESFYINRQQETYSQWERVTGKLTMQKFVSNIVYSVKNR